MTNERFDLLTTPIRPGRTLIEASAGTGKTFAITGLVLRMVVEGRITDLRRLLVVTFTIAATDELKNRIRAALRHALLHFTRRPGVDPKLRSMLEAFEKHHGAMSLDRKRVASRIQAALQQVDEAGVFTIHGFCKRTLEQAAFESGMPFAMSFLEEADDLLTRAKTDFWHRRCYANDVLAGLAVERGWGGDVLLDHYRNAHRYPETQILPQAPSLEDALDSVQRAMQGLNVAWDLEAVETSLAELRWNQGVPLDGPERRRYLEQVQAFARGEVAGNVEAVTVCSPEGIQGKASKRSNADKAKLADLTSHPAIMACGVVKEAIDTVERSLIHAFVDEVASRYEALKREQEVLTFDDLLRRLYHALRDPTAGPGLVRSIQDQYAVALIDEFQDTDPFQYDIFIRAFEGRPVFLIGDPKQAIYAFRGADIFAYLQAQVDADQAYSLGKNWRSATRLVEAVNALFKGHPRPFVYERIGFDEVEAAGTADAKPLRGDDRPPFVWWYVPPDTSRSSPKIATKGSVRPMIVQAIVREIQRLLAGSMRLGDRLLEPGDLAVLVRTNMQAAEVQEALRSVGIPSVVSKSGNILVSRELQELEYLLHAIAQPQDSELVRAALATECWGYTAAQIQRLNEDEIAWANLMNALRDWQRLWRRYGFLTMMYRFLDEKRVSERLLRFVDGERRMTNVRHGIELLHEAEQTGQRSMEELLHWLRARDARRLMEGEKSELRLESDADAVQISTMHGSKGLEYEIVFCPQLWDARPVQRDHKPLVHTHDGVVYDLGSSDHPYHLNLAEAERLAEDLRLAYVAMTRAKHRCYVVWGAIRDADASSLGYLLHGGGVSTGLAPEEHVAAAKNQVKDCLLDTRETLEALVEAYPNLMAIETIADVEAASVAPLGEEGRTATGLLQARVVSEAVRQRLQPWGLTSFSQWTASARGDWRLDHQQWTKEDIGEEEGIFAFAAGATAGQCLHEIIQHVDFKDVEGERTVRHVRHVLAQYGLADSGRHRKEIDPETVVLGLLRRLAQVELPEAGFKLGEVGVDKRLNEWRFALPMTRVSPAQYADTYEAHAATPVCADYPPLVRQLEAEAMEGFLIGIVDLVVEHDGRWYLFDWKSNHLGSRVEDYHHDALYEAMLTHHYVLQYHLYCVGLHRYLKTRLPNYDYDACFGGVWCVFLRGLVEGQKTGPHTGLYYDRPSRSLIEALDQQIGVLDYA